MRTNLSVLMVSIVLMAAIHVFALAYPEEALVVHIPFDEGKGNVAMDQSQNGFKAELERITNGHRARKAQQWNSRQDLPVSLMMTGLMYLKSV